MTYDEATLDEARRVIHAAGVRLELQSDFILARAIAIAEENDSALDPCVRGVIADMLDAADQQEIKMRLHERVFGSWPD
jgi:hypothetical protein